MSRSIMTTFTGRRFDMEDFDPSDISIRDVAHHLALINRFRGATTVPVSVAQHSVWVSRLCDDRVALQGLLHDAAEAYLGDVVKWQKEDPGYSKFREIEDRLQRAIFLKYGCPVEQDPSVTEADRLAVCWEARLFTMNKKCHVPDELTNRYTLSPAQEHNFDIIVGREAWHWQIAESKFLDRFRDLTKL